MPRNVRNFWISVVVDGKEQPLAFGPRNKDGGFDLTIKQRHNGCVTEALEILGREIDRRLVLTVRDRIGKTVHKNETLR